MKTQILVAGIISISLFSCKKDYTCTCITSATIPNTPNTTETYNLTKQKKKDAESRCKGYENQASFSYMGLTGTVTTNCTLN